ncbi:MAG: metallophosphoesterase family protein, partial [Pseudomonadota bacterium]
QAVLADIQKRGVDQTINLGDILSGPLQPAETADLLMEKNFITLRGNHERQVLELLDAGQALDPLSTDAYTASQLKPEHVAWLRSLPATLELNSEVFLCHGTPQNDLIYWLETTVPGHDLLKADAHPTGMRPATPDEVLARLAGVAHSLVLCGHTHVPRLAQCGEVLVVNPGSVGLQAYDDIHPHPHIVENGTPHARYALIEKTASGWAVDLRALPYDHGAQASVAAARKRPDWAFALQTGLMARSC